MQGIVTLLDAASAQMTRALWAELERDWGLREAAQSVPFPHISYHIAEEYDLARAGAALRRAAAQVAPFTARIMGLGAFTTPEQVLYLAVEHDPHLVALHTAIWEELADEGIAREPWRLYAPVTWAPHVTLAMRDLNAETLAALLTAWAARDLRWDIHITDLLLFGEGTFTALDQTPLTGTAG